MKRVAASSLPTTVMSLRPAAWFSEGRSQIATTQVAIARDPLRPSSGCGDARSLGTLRQRGFEASAFADRRSVVHGRRSGTDCFAAKEAIEYKFNGMETKYLPDYSGWRLMLEKPSVYLTPEHCLVAAIG
jgi:hypothetical protein